MDYRKLALAALEKRDGILAGLAEGTDLTTEQRAEVDALEAEARAHVEAAEAETKLNELRAKAVNIIVSKDAPEAKGEDAGEQLRALAKGEVREVSFKANDADVRNFQAARGGVEHRTATTTVATNAGNTIARTFVPQVIESLREQSPIFSLARVLTTSSGEPMDFPVKSGHVVPAAQTENVQIGKSDLSTSLVTSTVSKYGVIVEVSRELIDDSSLDIASMVAEDAGIELGRLAATNAMTALLGSATLGGTFAGTAAITADELMQAYHSLVTGYRYRSTWIANDSTMLYLRRNLKDSQGRYFWQDATLAGGVQDTLLTRPFVTDYNMPALATGNKSLVIGDLSKFLIRQVGDVRVTRSDEYGFDRDVVAFKVLWRGGFLLQDTAAVKYWKNS